MIGVISRQPVGCAPFLSELCRQAEHGITPPGSTGNHADGYGLALFRSGHWLHLREQCPIWQGSLSAVRELDATVMLLHARMASDPETIELTKLHPFCLPVRAPGIMFCQNGTIRNHQALRTRIPASAIDTEKYADLFSERVEKGQPLGPAIEDTARSIIDSPADPSSLNVLISDGSEMVAYTGGVLPRNKDYHTLWVAGGDDISVVSTERFEWRGAQWTPLFGVWRCEWTGA